MRGRTQIIKYSGSMQIFFLNKVFKQVITCPYMKDILWQKKLVDAEIKRFFKKNAIRAAGLMFPKR